ncbi:hypothetical protein ACOT81_38210 [Streptomyces sp. WI04-05B]|uniref:hypothetical protein n=1 Tax=Streptomyces TaxID=1883 RepID=UPI0029AA0974|nr:MULTISPECIES: hypothetical protein [unclassified Streptomyces]MDX2545899.1 hypothetical protein [Streptomyces sp. WI04-05B]MDX2586458.1 hypothetical protein [Streptomyces sp. WI04-05A]
MHCTDTEASAARDSAAALRPLLDALQPEMLTAIRETVAGAEKAAWLRVVARRVRAIAPGPYAVAVFANVGPKLGMGHDDYSARNVDLYAEAEDQDEPSETCDFDDAALTRALGALAELLRPSDGAQLDVHLDQEGEGN